MKTFEQYWEENGYYESNRIIAESAWNAALAEVENQKKQQLTNVNAIREHSQYKDGGTTSYSVISGPLKGETVFKDGRIQTKTFGKFFDRYPGDNRAKILEGYTFVITDDRIYK
jgi:hypothetical protein